MRQAIGKQGNNKVRATTLAVALLSVYGGAGAVVPDHILECNGNKTCASASGEAYWVSGFDGGSTFGAAVTAFDGGQILLDKSVITATDSFAMLAIEGGASITATGSTVQTNAGGLWVGPGGSMTLIDSEITMQPGSLFGALVMGVGETAKLTLQNTNIHQGDSSVGIYVVGEAGAAKLSGGSVIATGINAVGVEAMDGGQIQIDGTHITSTGAYAVGIGGQNGGVIRARNAAIRMEGDEAYGVIAEGQDSFVDLQHSSITTTGAWSEGIRVSDDGEVSMKGGSITTTGADAAGVHLIDSGSIDLSGVRVRTSGPSVLSSFYDPTATQTVVIGVGSGLLANNGTLLLVERESGAENGTINFTLKSGSFASGNIENRDMYGELVDALPGATNFVVESGAQWAGVVRKKADIVVADGATPSNARLNDTLIGVNGATISFSNGANLGGSFVSGAGSLTNFSGLIQIDGQLIGQHGAALMLGGVSTAIGQGVIGAQGSSFTFNGDTTIGPSVSGAGLSGTVLSGAGSIFAFSPSSSHRINGDVRLDQGARLTGGAISNLIQVQGDVAVNGGSILGGNLNVQGALNSDGGRLSPGNSVGVQTFGTAGAVKDTTYLAEVNAAGGADKIVIAQGDFDVSGITLEVGQENGNGGFRLNRDYTIVETSNGVVKGPFANQRLDSSLANTLVKLDTAKYGQSDIAISLSVDREKIAAKRGLTSNQSAALDGVASVAGLNASADATLLSPNVQAALDQLSGEAHAATTSALLNSNSLLLNTLSNRLRGNVGAGMLAGAPMAQASGSIPASAMPRSAASPLWAQMTGAWQTLDGDANAARVKNKTGGLFLGGDGKFGQGWRLGGALGFANSDIKVGDRSSTSDVDSYSAAIYGGNSWKAARGKVNFLAGAGYTRHSINSRRTVTVGRSQTLKADYHANTTQLFTELGYAFPVGQASVAEPYLGAAWLSQRTKGFSESGGDAALRSDSRTDDMTTFTVGLRGKTLLNVGKRETSLFAGLGWRHAAGDISPASRMSFIQGNGATFDISGAPIARNAAVAELGAETALSENAVMGLSYNGQFGNGNTDNAGSLYLKVRF